MTVQLCDSRVHLHRRTLLQAGVGAGFLSSIAQRLAVADENNKKRRHLEGRHRPKNVILLWMEGGPSQLETFDPHPGSLTGGDVQAIKTSTEGLEISELLPQTAEMMHLTSLVRSVTTKEGDHERAVYNVKTGFRPDPTLKHPSIGAILCHADQRGGDIPRHVSILPGQWPSRGGYLGPALDAFQTGDPANPVPDITSSVSQPRLRRRIDDLQNIVDREFYRGRLSGIEQNRTLHRELTASAMTMMSSEQLDAFDVTSLPTSELEAFGDTPFGRGCLAATQLVQAGVRCVEVTLSGWDTHAANHSFHETKCATLDPALASLLKRLDEQDQLDNTLVVWAGEFGRTPRINPAEGRDHWPHGFSVLLAGCGIRAGHVMGKTAADPPADFNGDDLSKVVENPVGIEDLHATILHALDLEHDHELETSIGRPMKRSEGRILKELLA
ncbi:MAG: DUF1501 domain-containing protein [Planctomycetota bacterium]